MTAPTLRQHTAETAASTPNPAPVPAVPVEPEPDTLKLSRRDHALMQSGALLMANARRQRDTVEDLVLIQEMRETGAYKQIVDEAGDMGGARPWEAFCRLIGWRRPTLDTQLKALKEFGPEVVGLIDQAGLPQSGVRALLAAPADLRAELAGDAEPTVDVLRRVVDMAQAANARAEREAETAQRERDARDKAEKARDKDRAKLAEVAITAADLKRENQRLRDGLKITSRPDVEKKLAAVEERFESALGLLGVIDWQTDRLTAQKVQSRLTVLIEELGTFEGIIRQEILG